eukprot:scaffold607_cov160-Ochromonas_danica.AAC.31
MSAPGENTTLKYLIFGLAFGTCLGNMFLAGKLKNLMKIKIPRTDYAKTAAEEAQRERARQESFKFNQESARRKNSKNQTVPSSAWTAWLSHCEPEMERHRVSKVVHDLSSWKRKRDLQYALMLLYSPLGVRKIIPSADE